jgi:hydroxymethylglutaryl-CoA reductase
MDTNSHESRIPGFYKLTREERRDRLAQAHNRLLTSDFLALDQGLSFADADLLSENVIGIYSLPFSVALNFIVDNQAVIIPMVSEEPSVVAAASKMAKIVAMNGGFFTQIDQSIIKGQVQLYGLKDFDKTLALLEAEHESLIESLNKLCPSMLSRGGGVVNIGFRGLKSRIGPMLLIEPRLNVVSAMGANIVNSLMEELARLIKPMIDGKIGLRILSNLCDERLAHARCAIPWRALASDEAHDNGEERAHEIIAAHAFAEADSYRACTHNKGILNGIDALALATGNDFRAIEAGAHAYAARLGSYGPLTSFNLDCEKRLLEAELSLPLAVGTVGGLTKMHNGVKSALKILGNFGKNAQSLSSVMVSLGLAQCLAAIFALSGEGIQKGHMRLHKKKSQGSLGTITHD